MPHEIISEDYLAQVAECIRLLGHYQRLRIIEYLDIHGESTVNAIVAGVGGQQAAVSQHLNKLRMAQIITARRLGRQVKYKIAMEGPITVLNCIRREYAELKEKDKEKKSESAE